MSRQILRATVAFELPEDFDGNFNDALQELIDFRVNKGHSKLTSIDGAIATPELVTKVGEVYDEIYDLLEPIEQKVTFAGFVDIVTLENDKWTRRKL